MKTLCIILAFSASLNAMEPYSPRSSSPTHRNSILSIDDILNDPSRDPMTGMKILKSVSKKQKQNNAKKRAPIGDINNARTP